jgi:hypothetical protein
MSVAIFIDANLFPDLWHLLTHRGIAGADY